VTVAPQLTNGTGPQEDVDLSLVEPNPFHEPRASPIGVDPFVGLTHDEVLELDFPEGRELIVGLVPCGAVGTIAGVPETHKSWLAHAIAVRVASGMGAVLGCDVVGTGRVGYFWQDDSTREEAERVKLFHRIDESPAGLPLRWFLNEGLELPADIGRLRDTVKALELVLVILDSFYNFLPGIDLKDDAAEKIVALLKREIADATGCSVLIVDHMPWATETNRQRLRAYGGVFKNAATRFGIYIDANGKNLSIEARGNNIRGFKKRAAYWDDGALELRLVEAGDHDEKVEQKAVEVLKFLEEHPGTHSLGAVRKGAHGGATTVDPALKLLKARDRVYDLSERDEAGSDRAGKPQQWIAAIHAPEPPLTLSTLVQTRSNTVDADPQSDDPVSSLYKGLGSQRDRVNSASPVIDEALE
jgi:hypothetical protein